MVMQLLAFLAVSVAVICTPGPDTALTVRNALAGGRPGGMWTAAGVSLGQSVWTVAASAGVAGLLRASAPAFLALRIAGAVYLLYLGVQTLRAAWRGHGHGTAAGRLGLRLSPRKALRQGFVNDLSNPKMAAFFVSLLPQFAPGGRAGFAAFLLLGLLFCAMTFGWLVVYTLAVVRARGFLGRPRIRRALDSLTGCVLVAFGVRLATEQR
ncbi:MAG: LysE family translocator [Mycobacteriales bacterium]